MVIKSWIQKMEIFFLCAFGSRACASESVKFADMRVKRTEKDVAVYIGKGGVWLGSAFRAESLARN